MSDIQQKLHREQIKAGLSVLLLACMFGLYGYFQYTIKELHTDVDSARTKYLQLMAHEDTREERAQLLAQTKEDREALQSFILQKNNPTLAPDLVEELGAITGVEVEVIGLSEGVEDKNEAVKTRTNTGEANQHFLSMVLSVEGSWERVYHMLALLEKFPYISFVDKVAFEEKNSKEKGTLWSGQVHMQLIIE